MVGSYIFLVGVWTGINILCQMISVRWVPRCGLLGSLILGFFTGLFALGIGEYFFLRGTGIACAEKYVFVCVDVIIYTALGYTYFHFVNMSETARRIRLLIELFSHPQGMSLEELLARYNAQEILAKRFSRMIKNRQIIERDGKYFIGTPVLLWMARILYGVQALLFTKHSCRRPGLYE